MPIASSVLGIVLVSAVPAAQTAPGVHPPAPRQPAQVAPPTAPAERPRVVCGMTLITPDDRTAFPIRELTPPPNAPRFTMRTIPGECERVTQLDHVVALPRPRPPTAPLFPARPLAAPPPIAPVPKAPSH